jgi:hypothetical protein
MAPLPPWIRSIKRPLDQLTRARRCYDDLPDTEPGEALAAPPRLRPGAGEDIAHIVTEDLPGDAAPATDPPEGER